MRDPRDFYRGRRVLVTGGLGSNLSRTLRQGLERTIAYDKAHKEHYL